MARVAVLQSNYIPWKGYFDIIHDVDVFVFYDDVQFTKNDWRNRNCIKTQNGRSWLTVPVGSDLNRRVCDVQIFDSRWQTKHWRSLEQYYRKAPYFADYAQLLAPVYLDRQWQGLSDLNRHLIELIARECLGLSTTFLTSQDYVLDGNKQERLLGLLKQLGTSSYVSGPAAKDYIDEQLFADAGIDLVWKNYGGYPEYPQFFPPFEHAVTILDLLFHTGAEAPWYIWGWRLQQ